VAIVTGHERQGGDRVDLAALGQAADTVVFLMGVLQLRPNLQAMIDGGLDPQTPAALVRWASRPDQQTVVGVAGDLADRVEALGVRPPAVVIVGHVVAHRDRLAWFEGRSLFGRTVAVTRPLAAADALVDQLAELGAAVLRAPAIALHPAADPAALVADLPGYDWLVLTSRNAVDSFAAALHGAGLDGRALAGLTVGCVGPATVNRLWDTLRVRADCVPETEFRAEALAQALVAKGVSGKRILHPRASAGSDDLAVCLRAAGAHVDDPVAYETRPVDSDPVALRQALAARSVDVVTFASGSAVDALVGRLGAQAFAETTIAAIGPVTVQALRRHGLDAQVVPERSTAHDLVDAVVDHLLASEPVGH
jgi:uroporphyrinogen III methyltransferase/synthase